MTISEDDRRLLLAVRAKFLEHKNLSVFCALAHLPCDHEIKLDRLAGDFANYFQNEIIPDISGGSTFSAPNPGDPDRIDFGQCIATAESVEIIFIDGKASALSQFEQLANEARACVPSSLRNAAPMFCDPAVAVERGRHQFRWLQLMFNILARNPSAIGRGKQDVSGSTVQYCWFREKLFLAAADAIGVMLGSDPDTPLIGGPEKYRFTQIEKYPNTADGNMGYLEFARDDVSVPAWMKHHQHQERYTNREILAAIHLDVWEEAQQRFGQLAEMLPGEAADAITEAFGYPLNERTVTDVDRLLNSAVSQLRAAFQKLGKAPLKEQKPFATEAPDAGASEIRIDGLYPPNLLVFSGRSTPVQPIPWRLLAFMWDRDSALMDDVCQAVWGDTEKLVADRSVVNAIGKANFALRAASVPWVLGVKAGHVVRKSPKNL